MTDLLLAFQVAIAAAFGLLAVRTVVSWLRQPDVRHGYLALALGSLALLILIAPGLGGSGAAAQALTDAAVALFLLSGYALVMFRDSFVPLAPTTRRLIAAAIFLVFAAAVAVQLPADPQRSHTRLASFALAAVLVTWSLCILEPTVRFWLVGRGRPAVEAARLHALSVGYAGILFVVIVGTFAAGAGQVGTLVIDLVTLAAVPLLWVSFAPPAWLRRIWRQPVEDQYRRALHDLLLYSPDRETLALRAIGWAQRLVGGDGALFIDPDGSILATHGVSADEAQRIAAKHDLASAAGLRLEPWRRDHLVVIPLDLQSGRAAMVIVSGRTAPIFGDDEMGRLLEYAISTAAGLDRVTLNSRLQALERAKSDFLNIASHELRGPITIIKGYLTMFESGALGDLSPKVGSVLPLLIAKSDEISWMLEQMLEASRLEEGRLELNKKRGDLVNLTDRAIDGVKMLLRGHDLTMDEPAEAVEADLDPDRIQMVVRNLLSNAAKYSPAGSQITVRITRQGGVAKVSVTDQGVGIRPEDQAVLFTRFGRIRNAQRVQGTGLGLWLSREIARMHDGDLTVQSTPGIGSTFVLAVPLRQ